MKAIKQLEALTGNTWENPYEPENERFTLKLTDEERTLIENIIKDGCYTSEAIQERKDQKKREEYEKKRNITMIETLILLGCLYLSIRVTDYIEKQKQNNNN